MAICHEAVPHLKEESDELCCACRNRNKTTAATNYCLDCDDHFCEECVEIHKVVPALLGHTIKITAELQGESQTFQRCKSHTGKKLDMYCLTHGRVVCYMCINMEHRLPSNPELQNQWILAVWREIPVNKAPWQPGMLASLGYKHFNYEHFQGDSGYMLFKPGAVPIMFNFPTSLFYRSCTLKLVTDGSSSNTEEQLTVRVTEENPTIIRLQALRKIGEIKLAIRKLRELKHISINEIKYFKKELCDWIDQLEQKAIYDIEFKCEELMNKWQVDADEIKTYMDESVSQESDLKTARGKTIHEDGKLSVSEKCMLALSQKIKSVSPIIKCASFKPDTNLKKMKETLQELGMLELKFMHQDDMQTISETFAKPTLSVSTQTRDPQMQQLMPSNVVSNISPQTNSQVTSGPMCYPQQTLQNPSTKALPQPYTHADGRFAYSQPTTFTYAPGTFSKAYVGNVQQTYYQYPSPPPPTVHAYGGFTGITNTSNGKMPTRTEAVSQVKQGTIAPAVNDLTASMLAEVPPNEQKQMLGEHLFPLIHRLYPDLAGKITGMLLEMDNSALLPLLGSQECLKTKVKEAIAVLLAHQVKEAKEAFEATVDK